MMAKLMTTIGPMKNSVRLCDNGSLLWMRTWQLSKESCQWSIVRRVPPVAAAPLMIHTAARMKPVCRGVKERLARPTTRDCLWMAMDTSVRRERRAHVVVINRKVPQNMRGDGGSVKRRYKKIGANTTHSSRSVAARFKMSRSKFERSFRRRRAVTSTRLLPNDPNTTTNSTNTVATANVAVWTEP